MSTLPRLLLALALTVGLVACDSSSDSKSDDEKKEDMMAADRPGQEDCEKFHEKLVEFAVAEAKSQAGMEDLGAELEAEVRKSASEGKEATIAECKEKGSKTVINCGMKQKTLAEFEENCTGKKK